MQVKTTMDDHWSQTIGEIKHKTILTNNKNIIKKKHRSDNT